MTENEQARRKKMLAAIHIAKNEALEGDEDIYRGLIRRISSDRTESAGSLSMVELKRVMDDLRRIGWRPRRNPKEEAQRRALLVVAKKRAFQVMGDGWRNRLDGIARKVAGVDKIEWVRSPKDLRRVLAVINGISNQ